MLMSSDEYRDSLRRYRPVVFGERSARRSVADEPVPAPGIDVIGVTYDFARAPEHERHMVAVEASSGRPVSRMLQLNRNSDSLLRKLESVRLVCRHSGRAPRYVSPDPLWQAPHRTDAEERTDYHARFEGYLHRVQAEASTLGVAMTDAKGDRSRRPHEQANPDA